MSISFRKIFAKSLMSGLLILTGCAGNSSEETFSYDGRYALSGGEVSRFLDHSYIYLSDFDGMISSDLPNLNLEHFSLSQANLYFDLDVEASKISFSYRISSGGEFYDRTFTTTHSCQYEYETIEGSEYVNISKIVIPALDLTILSDDWLIFYFDLVLDDWGPATITFNGYVDQSTKNRIPYANSRVVVNLRYAIDLRTTSDSYYIYKEFISLRDYWRSWKQEWVRIDIQVDENNVDFVLLNSEEIILEGQFIDDSVVIDFQTDINMAYSDYFGRAYGEQIFIKV